MPPDRAPLETRLREALQEAAREQPMRADFAASVAAGLPDQRAPRPRGWRRFALPSAVALAGILVVIGYSLFSSLTKGPASGTTAPSTSASQSPVVVGPAIVKGQTPAPDATAPPNLTFLPGVTLSTLADFAGSLAMDCVSYGPGGERPSPYLLHCEAFPGDKTTEIVFEAGYWTRNAIRDLHLTVIPALGQSTANREVAAAAVSALTGVRYGGADTIGTTQWAVAGINKSECFGAGCLRDVGGVRILLMVGVSGALGMTLEPVPSPSVSPTPYALSSWRLVHLELPADLAGHLVNGVSSDGRLVLVQEPQAAQSVHLIVSPTDVRDLIVPGHTQGAPIGSLLSPDGRFVLLSELGQAWRYDIASMVYTGLPNPPGTTGGQFSMVDAQHLLVLTGPLASYEFGGTTNTQLWRLDLNTLTYMKLGTRHDGIAAYPAADGGAVLLTDTSLQHDNTGWIFYRILPDGSDHVLYDYRAHYPGPFGFAVAPDGDSIAFTNTAGRSSLYEGSSGAVRDVGAGIVRDFSPDSVLLRLEQKDGTVEAIDRSGTIVYSVPGPASGWIRVP